MDTSKAGYTPGPWYAANERLEDSGFREILAGPECRSIRIALNCSTVSNARLIAAAPDLLEACKAAAELISTSRQYFPKSIQNGDKFRLENTCAAIGKAIHKAGA